MTHRLIKFFVTAGVSALVFASGLPARPESLDREGELAALAKRQQVLMIKAEAAGSQQEVNDLRTPMQDLAFDYEAYLRKYPEYALGYLSYAKMLMSPLIDDRKHGSALLLRANQLDSDLAPVKSMLGNYLAEEGRPLEALNYFLSAVTLEPKVAQYHYQIGLLIAEAQDDFLQTGDWKRDVLDRTMQNAFMQAAALDPENMAYAYRYAESYYDIDPKDWEAALTAWKDLESHVSSGVEKQTMRLHQANVLIKMGKPAEARALLETVDETVLVSQKQKLLTELAGAKS